MSNIPLTWRKFLTQAKENVTFYQESGNTAGVVENAYILHHYTGRAIPEFYLYDGWEALLSYDFFRSVDSAFTYFSGSTHIHTGERKRDDPHSVLLQTRQMASAYFQMRRWSDICMDTDNPVRPVKLPGIWGFCAALRAGGSPLYAIESYQYTPFSGSILLFYGVVCGLKAIGFSVTALLLILFFCLFPEITLSLLDRVGA